MTTIRKYYKYQNWSQPVSMSSNGILGGESFAVAAEYEYYNTYWAYHGLDSTGWLGTQGISWYIFYNPEPLKVIELTFSQISNNYIQNYNLYVSNDGNKWIFEGSYVQGSGTHTNTISVSKIGYKYYKIIPTSVYTRSAFCNLVINAKKIVESTSSDYDFYIDTEDSKIKNAKATKETIRKYYKYQTWAQPVLSANGTMGGDAFACNQSAYHTESSGTKREAWAVFSNTDNRWQVNRIDLNTFYYVEWYNPKALYITSINVTNSTGDYSVASYILYGSNDYSNWIELTSGTNNNTTTGSSWTIGVSSTSSYKYFRLSCKGRVTTSVMIYKLSISAYTGIEESTSSDYDFYKDIDIYKMNKESKRKYYKYLYSDWVRPNITSNGIIGSTSFACSGGVSNPWLCFDGNNNTYGQFYTTTDDYKTLYFYNPNPIKISSINFTYYPNYYIKEATFYGSKDNNNWSEIISFTNNENSNTVEFPANVDAYSYYKLYITSANGNNGSGQIIIADIYEMTFNAQQLIGTQESTSSDYDFYKDIDEYKVFKI